MKAQSTVRLIEAVVHGRALVSHAGIEARAILVGFHGYAESAETQMRRLENIPGSEGCLLVSVQGLNRFYRGRSDEVVAGWMTRQDREAAIDDNVHYVNSVIASIIEEQPSLRTKAVIHIGYSQGVAMAFRAAVRGRYGSAGVIAIGGDVPPELLADPDSRFPAVLLARGDRDEWYTAEKLEQDAAALTARGVAVRTSVFGGSHEWHEAVNAIAAGFIDAVALRQR